jgi:hypothetical protein
MSAVFLLSLCSKGSSSEELIVAVFTGIRQVLVSSWQRMGRHSDRIHRYELGSLLRLEQAPFSVLEMYGTSISETLSVVVILLSMLINTTRSKILSIAWPL